MAKNDRLSMCRAESVFAAVRWANLVLIGYGAALRCRSLIFGSDVKWKLLLSELTMPIK